MRATWNRLPWLGLALAVLWSAAGCEQRKKERHRELYLEYLAKLTFAYEFSKGAETEAKEVLPTTPYEAGKMTANIDKSNLDSKQLLTDLKKLGELEPVDEMEREILNRITEASILFNYYLSYRVMGPLVIMNVTPATRSRFKLDSIKGTEDFAMRIEEAIAESREMLRNW